ncbi:MAG: linear amide C-N hydrolase [bacterium]|nr:MAG: linear amide C-N hydrolase [bacterium]
MEKINPLYEVFTNVCHCYGSNCVLCAARIFCSTFVLVEDDALLFGKNWDFYTSKGMIVVNKREIAKTALIMPPDRPAKWVSKYGSITFNQIGREFPYGGMNEEGLVVEIMWLDETKYPASNGLPVLNEVQWIQYQLDNCRTVGEVIERMDSVRIGQNWSRIHYLIGDRFRSATAIEYINGETVCHTGDSLTVAALTNSTYDECIQLFDSCKNGAPDEWMKHSSLSSTDRFIKIARRLGDFESEHIGPAIEYAFDILSSVSVGRFKMHRTAWSIVYDIANMKIYFKSFENRNVSFIDVHAFDFSNETPSQVLNIAGDLKGDVAGNFIDYSRAMNKAMIVAVFDIYREADFLTNLPASAVHYLARYPETFTMPSAVP